jgi:hypothetical protein
MVIMIVIMIRIQQHIYCLTSAVVVSAYDDVFHLEHVYGILDHTHAVEVRT